MIIAIPEALREKLGPEAARALADLLNEASVQKRGDVVEIGATRIQSRQAEELAEEFAAFRADLHGIERRLIRWMFVFWIGQIGALLGILFAFFRP